MRPETLDTAAHDPRFELWSPAAAQAAYRAHVDDVARWVRRRGVGDAELDDVVQTVFVTFFQKFDCNSERASARTWLYSTTQNVCRNTRRSLFGRLKRWASGELAEALPSTTRSADSLLERQQAQATLERVLSTLDAGKRQVFELAELEQLTLNEIGELLQLSPNTVGSRLAAARAQFETALARDRRREQGARP